MLNHKGQERICGFTPGSLATLAGMKEGASAESVLATNTSPDPNTPIPKQIRYIIGSPTVLGVDSKL